MKYFFILGNNPALSLAEIIATVKPKSFDLITEEFLLVEAISELNAGALMNQLGGIIKIGIVRHDLDILDYKQKLPLVILDIVKYHQKETTGGKFNFGFSNYSNIDIKNLGLEIKKKLTSLQISSRFVVSKDKTLSSVVVEQNKLLRKGVEINFATFDDKILLGETLAVQPFKSLSYRDFSRPARDDKSGMLPPKLAKVMINLSESSHSGLLVDPFCGSGTILSEAILMGFNNLLGSDISFKAVSDSKRNIYWIKEQYEVRPQNLQLKVKNVLDLSKFIRVNSVEAFVTEPYLGPQRGKIEFSLVIKELEYLYTKALEQMFKTLVKSGRVVMVWPVFYGNKFINPDISHFKKVDILPEYIKKHEVIKRHISSRGNIIYGRKGQKVFREIIVLEKE